MAVRMENLGDKDSPLPKMVEDLKAKSDFTQRKEEIAKFNKVLFLFFRRDFLIINFLGKQVYQKRARYSTYEIPFYPLGQLPCYGVSLPR